MAGGLLICTLVILLAFRFVAHKRARVDAMVVASPFALVFSILYLLAYGVNILSSSLLIFVILVFFTNYRALQRFASGLYVDYYHTYFRVASVIEAFLAIGFVVVFIIFAPVADTPTKGFSLEKKLLSGNATSGLTEKTEFLQSTDGILYELTGLQGEDENKPILLYVPDFFCQSHDFMPILGAYARDGYKVLAADLYLEDVVYISKFWDAKFIRPFSMRMHKIYKSDFFENQLNIFILKKKREISTIKKYIETQYPNKEIVFLGDTYSSQAAKNLFLEEKIIKYDWGGCGLISQTLPLEYEFFVSKQQKN